MIWNVFLWCCYWIDVGEDKCFGVFRGMDSRKWMPFSDRFDRFQPFLLELCFMFIPFWIGNDPFHPLSFSPSTFQLIFGQYVQTRKLSFITIYLYCFFFSLVRPLSNTHTHTHNIESYWYWSSLVISNPFPIGPHHSTLSLSRFGLHKYQFGNANFICLYCPTISIL